MTEDEKAYKAVAVHVLKPEDGKGDHNKKIDLDQFATAIEESCNRLREDGFEVISILPIQESVLSGHVSVPVTISPTRGVIIVGRVPQEIQIYDPPR